MYLSRYLLGNTNHVSFSIMKIPLDRPNITALDLKELHEVIDSGQLVQGKYVELLESKFSEAHENRFSVAVSNGTTALHLALLSLGVGPDDEVIVTAYSFVASANAIVHCGAKPIFCDVGTFDFNMNSVLIEPLITQRTKAILIVHEFGFPAHLELILEIAKRRNLFVVEDAACSLGTQVHNRRLGVFGDLACFSFHPRKLITSGEGGMVLTSRQDLDSFLRISRNHGLALEGVRRYSKAGYNYRMTDISASLLLPQLARLEKIVEARNYIAQQYLDKIVNPKLSLPCTYGGVLYNWQTFPVRLRNELDLELFLIHMSNLGIMSSKPAQFIPMEPHYIDNGSNPDDFPNAKSTYFRTAAIPLFELMSAEDVVAVIEACNAF